MIRDIIPAITPQNIWDIQVLKDAMNIFLDYLVENSDIAIDIKNIFDSKKVPIYEEFVKIYLDNIYKVLSKKEHNEALYRKLEAMYSLLGHNIEDIDMSIDAVKLLTTDFILTNKDYKQSKGTSKAMEYIYNIIIQSDIQKDFLQDNEGRFRFLETGYLFEYSIEGTMIAELYEYFVKPLSHPVGWAYFYSRVFYLSFIDYFDLEFMYTINAMEVRCMNGDIREKDDYKLNISHLGEPLVVDNTVDFISNEDIGPIGGKKYRRTTVYFKSGEILVSVEEPRSLKLYNVDGTIKIDYDLYDGNCGLYLDYTVETKTTVKDDISFMIDMPSASTTGKIISVGAGNVFVGNFTLGDFLVNKNVSVTYGTFAGMNDGTMQVQNFAIGALKGATMVDEYEWEQILVKDPLVNKDFEDTFKDEKFWDQKDLRFDRFIFDDAYVMDEFTIDSIKL